MKLSICVATYKRGKFIGETLDSILSQMQAGVEIIVVDGASPDNTPEVMKKYSLNHPEIRYYRERENSGVDADYDKAVGYALGDYCWLMTDDDLLLPGAIGRVLAAIAGVNELIVVNAEVKNADCSKTLAASLVKRSTDRKYTASERETLFIEVAQCLSFIGCVVIKREVWLGRNRSSYYGTLFVHVGVIFQEPPLETTTVIAEPSITIRYGNAMWSPRGFEIWMFKWPRLIWSFEGLSDRAKARVCPREPWRHAKRLVLSRATGEYSYAEYRRFLAGKVGGLQRILALGVARMPAPWVNAFASVYILLSNRRAGVSMYDISRSPAATWASRLAARIYWTFHIR
jgi:glycosyltransferase involved in cell wall biosynthesis